MRVPLAVLLVCALAACTASTTTVTKTRTVTVRPSAPSPDPTHAARHRALVTRVVDGDTAHVTYHGRDVTIRFIGVDTPETVAPGRPIECYGPEASAFTTRALTGETVRLEFDVDRIDRYGRTLAYVWLAGTLFNETLVRDGYATVATYPPDTKYATRFEAAQRRASAARRGLWNACPHG